MLKLKLIISPSFLSSFNYQSIDDFFSTLCNNANFRDQIWQKKPILFKSKISSVEFTMDDVKEAVDKDFLEAGRG